MNKQIKRIMGIIFILICLIVPFVVVQAKSSDVVNQKSNIYEPAIVTLDDLKSPILNTYYLDKINELIKENEKLTEENEQLLKENEELKKLSEVTDAEWEALYRVARAEAGANAAQAQKNVVYVVLNRVNSDKFSDTIEDVIHEKGQFACVSDGNYYKVEISDFTISNVREAYLDYVYGESAQGALFFTRGTFDRTYLFTDEVEHNFYK